jgi:hypothetical protein
MTKQTRHIVKFHYRTKAGTALLQQLCPSCSGPRRVLRRRASTSLRQVRGQGGQVRLGL